MEARSMKKLTVTIVDKVLWKESDLVRAALAHVNSIFICLVLGQLTNSIPVGLEDILSAQSPEQRGAQACRITLCNRTVASLFVDRDGLQVVITFIREEEEVNRIYFTVERRDPTVVVKCGIKLDLTV